MHMKFKFSVTVTENKILQLIIKQSLLTRNVRKLSNNCQLTEKYKTDFAFLSVFIQNLIIITPIYYINLISIKKKHHEGSYSCKLDTKQKEPKIVSPKFYLSHLFY